MADLKPQILRGQIVEGMSFNQKVWAMTARIPRGKLATYGDIARALGTRACRAVGNALNRNPYAPAVPCHRVVGSNGALTGFAGGLRKKGQLLSSEGIHIRNDRADLCKRCSPDVLSPGTENQQPLS